MKGPSRLVVSLTLLAAALVPAVASAAPGSVTLVRSAGTAGTPAEQAFLRSRVWRMHGATAWDTASWARRSAYALDATTLIAHPEWVLKDAGGTPVFLGTAVAADFGNPAYRAWWIAQATAQAAGLRGLYVDDVSMERRVNTAFGALTLARDPRTGATMTEANWQRYMADFMVELRTALPAAEIVHDVLWHKGDAATNIARELAAASAVAIEKGFNDAAILTSSGTYGWETLAGFVARRQTAGSGVILDGYADAPAARLYGLGASLLFDTGTIAVGNDAWTAPNRYWAGYDVRLGAPTAARYQWSDVWRRDFANGTVLVNQPGNSARSVTLGPNFVDLDGVAQNQLTLVAASAIVVVKRAPVAPTPTPAPPIAPTVTPEPASSVPVATPTPTPRKPARPSSAVTAHIAGAAGPKATTTTVSVWSLGVAGRVAGAVGGYVRVSVQRKRGSGWSTVRRVKPAVSKRGTFKAPITRLSRGTYRVVATFEGTGTAEPSRSEYKQRSL